VIAYWIPIGVPPLVGWRYWVSSEAAEELSTGRTQHGCRIRLPSNDYLVTSPSGEAMTFLCLIYEDPKQMRRMPKTELATLIADYMTFTKEIEKSGHFKTGDALEPAHTPSTVRVRNGKVSTSDGPQEKSKNTIGGFYVIRAKDLQEAIHVASRIPGARFGSVEVRPIHQYAS